MRAITALWACLLVLCACDPEPEVDWDSFDLQGHRGCRGLMPENSSEGMKMALELGVKTLVKWFCLTSRISPVRSVSMPPAIPFTLRSNMHMPFIQ